MSYYAYGSYGTSQVARQILGNMAQMGFFDFVLPWLFAFAIVYGILLMSGLFNEQKTIYAVLAMVVAFFATNYSPYGTNLAFFFSNLFGGGIFVLAGLLVIMLFLVLFIGNDWRKVITDPLTFILKLFGASEDATKGQYIIFGIVLLGIGAWLFLSSANWFGIQLPAMRADPTTTATIIILVVIIAVVWLIAKSS